MPGLAVYHPKSPALRWLLFTACACVTLTGAGCSLVRTPIDEGSLASAPGPERSTRPATRPRGFEHVLIVVLENQDYSSVMGDGRRAGNPYLRGLAAEGALFTNFKGLFHPSYPNYLAMIGGREFEVDETFADSQVDFPRELAGREAPTIGDYLTWKNYAERYPADRPQAFRIGGADRYVRRHVPFLSFRKWQRTSGIVAVDPDAPDDAFFRDADDPAAFPQYAFYSPDLIHDGHDSDLKTAAGWLEGFLSRFRRTPVAASTLVVITFDESSGREATNRIYTLFWGPMVRPGLQACAPYNHYNVLRTIEDNFGVAPFAEGDRRARVIEDVWRGE